MSKSDQSKDSELEDDDDGRNAERFQKLSHGFSQISVGGSSK